jgi:hypothetical protein
MTSFAVGYVYDVECAMSWHRQLMNLVDHDMSTRQRIAPNGILGRRCGTGMLPEARNYLVRDFLRTEAEWLIWLDTDMGFPVTLADQFLAVADKDTAPIVGGLCFMQTEAAPDGLGGYKTQPSVTIYDWVEEDNGRRFLRNTMSRDGYPVNQMVRCGGTGSACVIVHRSVFEAIEQRDGPVWYDRAVNPTTGVLQGEDLSFCERAGVPIHVHTGIRTSHLKRVWLQEDDYWDRFLPPPAELPTAVIVPVMNRPASAAPFMRYMRASTGLANVYAICDPPDTSTQDAWRDAGANVIISDRGYTFAQKVNCGYEHTSEPVLFFTGDDIHPYPGWLDHAQHVMVRDGVGLVATNDLGNARVTSGEHATHPLISRQYIDERGASWDGPKTVAHEGYGHWYVDEEWSWVAKLRGEFGAALGSVVEHLHPIWGKGDDDATYRRGQASVNADRLLWERRVREYARHTG